MYKALSIKQPWAILIAFGLKDIENRTWQTHFRGKIYIHACGKPINRGNLYNVLDEKLWDFVFDQSENFNADNIYYSAIIGEVEIIDCVVNHPSIWAEKTEVIGKTVEGELLYNNKPIWNWVLANAKLYDKPILNVKGKLSFWEPDIIIEECISCNQKFDLETMEEDDAGEKFCLECWEVLSPIMQQEAKDIKESEFCECSDPK